MAKLYKYTLLKQDGTVVDLAPSHQKNFSELYLLLDCSTIQIIPRAYYKYKGRCTVYGDEEARFSTKHKIKNPHFKDLGFGFDVVGDCIREEVLK